MLHYYLTYQQILNYELRQFKQINKTAIDVISVLEMKSMKNTWNHLDVPNIATVTMINGRIYFTFPPQGLDPRSRLGEYGTRFEIAHNDVETTNGRGEKIMVTWLHLTFAGKKYVKLHSLKADFARNPSPMNDNILHLLYEKNHFEIIANQ